MSSTWQVRSLCRYLAASVACTVFAVVYEYFGHGVFSPFMTALGGVPLVLGVVPATVCLLRGVELGWMCRQLWASAVLTLTLGCCFAGVMEIYGTTSPYVAIYAAMGMFLAAGSLFAGVSGWVRAMR